MSPLALRSVLRLVLSVCTLALPLWASPADAQTILNTERFQLGEVEGFHLGADVTASVQRGNTELLDVNTSGIVGVLADRHWPRLIFGARYLSDAERALLDRHFIQLRYSFIFSPETMSFHFVQLQRNESLLLRRRWLLGTGIRRTLHRTDRTEVAVGSGVMGEWERLDPEGIRPGDPSSLEALRMANLAVLSHELPGGARLLNILYLQPDLTSPSDLRVLSDLGLQVPVSEHLVATASLEWRRDTRPPAPLARDDLVVRMGLGVNVR